MLYFYSTFDYLIMDGLVFCYVKTINIDVLWTGIGMLSITSLTL